MLYIIPTPIGHLADWTFRSLDTVKSCDYLLCEDTRKTSILLQHYSIKISLRSFHSFNERKEVERIVSDLESGKTIGLVSDAGTPLICDPGTLLLEVLQEKGLSYCALPGPCAFVTALSALPTSYDKIQFLGFLPEKNQARKNKWLDMATYEGISGFYVSPHDIINYLKELETIDGNSFVYIFRELTKMFEERLQGSPAEMLNHFISHPPRGEFVVFIKGTLQKAHIVLTPDEILHILTAEYNMKPSLAAKLTSQLTGASRKQLYKDLSC